MKKEACLHELFCLPLDAKCLLNATKLILPAVWGNRNLISYNRSRSFLKRKKDLEAIELPKYIASFKINRILILQGLSRSEFLTHFCTVRKDCLSETSSVNLSIYFASHSTRGWESKWEWLRFAGLLGIWEIFNARVLLRSSIMMSLTKRPGNTSHAYRWHNYYQLTIISFVSFLNLFVQIFANPHEDPSVLRSLNNELRSRLYISLLFPC